MTETIVDFIAEKLSFEENWSFPACKTKHMPISDGDVGGSKNMKSYVAQQLGGGMRAGFSKEEADQPPCLPQVYYVGLLAGEIDFEAVERTGERREMNRHNFTLDEIEQPLQKDVVQRLLKFIDSEMNTTLLTGTTKLFSVWPF